MGKNKFNNIQNEIRIDDILQVKNFIDKLMNNYNVLDIGCGHGDFLIDQAIKYPEKHFIGIEISRKRVYKTSQRLIKRNIFNFSLIPYEAELAIKLLLPDQSINEIHINFPDPWLKKKQWKNRLIKPSFVIHLNRILRKDGIINYVTDVFEYAQNTKELLLLIPELNSNYKNIIEKNLYNEYPTLYYKKMSQINDIYYISFKKIKNN